LGEHVYFTYRLPTCKAVSKRGVCPSKGGKLGSEDINAKEGRTGKKPLANLSPTVLRANLLELFTGRKD